MKCAAEPKNIQHLPEWDQLSDRGPQHAWLHPSEPALSFEAASASRQLIRGHKLIKKSPGFDPGFTLIERAETEVASNYHRNTILLESKREWPHSNQDKYQDNYPDSYLRLNE